MKKIKLIIYIIPLIFLVNFSEASEVEKKLIDVGVVVGAPEADLKSGEYLGPQNVKLIYNGSKSFKYSLGASSTLSCIDGVEYKEVIHINKDTVLKAISCYEDNASSSISEYKYIIKEKPIDIPKRRGGFKSTKNNIIKGEVLGESTEKNICGSLLSKPIIFGLKNDIKEVIILQQFLNDEFKAQIPLTGYFGKITRDYVIKYQEKYKDEILNGDKPTGNVYFKTLKRINKNSCQNKSI